MMGNTEGYSVALTVDLRDIDSTLRPASLMRVHLSEEAIGEYAESIDRMPPVKLIYDRAAGVHWLVDGCHTISGAQRKRRREITAQVKDGTYLDAFREACRANDIHGVRVTNADKRRRVEEAIKHPDLKSKSQGWIADLCGVTQPFVSKLDTRSAHNGYEVKTTGKDGKQYSAKPPKPKQPRKEPFECHQCGEQFDKPVWHCHMCGGHWPDSENTCPECRLAREDFEDNPEIAPDHPREPLPGQSELPIGEDEPGEDEESTSEWESRWASVEEAVMREYRAWPEEARGFFAMNLQSLTSKVLAATSSITVTNIKAAS
jgi:hypothetical protein